LTECPYEKKFVGEVLSLLEQKYNKDFDQIETVCTYFSPYRDKAAHTAVYSLDDLLKIRNEIINNLNSLIDLFYDKYKVSLDSLIKDSHSPNKYKRLDAIMALGRSGSERAIKPLFEALSDNKGVIRGFAVESIGQLGNKSTAVELHKYYSKERDSNVCNRMLRVYQKLRA
jgi:HEAT repeat protein